jgi:hypothetical protein
MYMFYTHNTIINTKTARSLYSKLKCMDHSMCVTPPASMNNVRGGHVHVISFILHRSPTKWRGYAFSQHAILPPSFLFISASPTTQNTMRTGLAPSMLVEMNKKEMITKDQVTQTRLGLPKVTLPWVLGETLLSFPHRYVSLGIYELNLKLSS